MIDFDRDGVADLVLFAGATDISSHVFLYVLRGACGHFVGYFLSDHTPDAASTGTSHGLVDIEGNHVGRRGCGSASKTIYRFDGTVYREAETVRLPTLPCGPGFRRP
ncbi:MAG: hypothetical protein ACHREM_06175 [Polyangiales bacterium]